MKNTLANIISHGVLCTIIMMAVLNLNGSVLHSNGEVETHKIYEWVIMKVIDGVEVVQND